MLGINKEGLRILGIGLVYLGCMTIVSSVKLPKENLIFPMSCLLGLGLFNVLFGGKLSSKFYWYKSLMVAITLGVVASPFVILSMVQGGQ